MILFAAEIIEGRSWAERAVPCCPVQPEWSQTRRFALPSKLRQVCLPIQITWMNLIKDESMLSSISNISVLIKPNDGSSVFNFSLVAQEPQQPDHSDKLCEVKLDDLFPRDDHHTNNSLIDRFIKKEEKDCSIIHFYPTPILPQFVVNNAFNERSWMISQRKGVSEDEGAQDQGEQERENKRREEANDRKLKNETKNIPKNYGKAIISFMEKQQGVVEQVCQKYNVPFDHFFAEMLEFKKTINTIADLRRLWVDYKYAKCARVLSNLFFRKYSLSYIFNSRICNFSSHIKYRHRLWDAVRSPNSFNHIKDF